MWRNVKKSQATFLNVNKSSGRCGRHALLVPERLHALSTLADALIPSPRSMLDPSHQTMNTSPSPSHSPDTGRRHRHFKLLKRHSPSLPTLRFRSGSLNGRLETSLTDTGTASTSTSAKAPLFGIHRGGSTGKRMRAAASLEMLASKPVDPDDAPLPAIPRVVVRNPDTMQSLQVSLDQQKPPADSESIRSAPACLLGSYIVEPRDGGQAHSKSRCIWVREHTLELAQSALLLVLVAALLLLAIYALTMARHYAPALPALDL
ncbi:uncharacterized protein MONBRDRAFT_36143 [Monosiga brevicollis MX1]|uniref:Uncharacterized protein n=1 Tax=Monosiga brevicollis TaxID=81824 RepID=A9UTC1_MONBE|nr:uncharacterized protein MONBRDRAFT_36143 [Monosiga brevicollis MX1]EDQ91466.1 predicted protein [Monosiga brevicollis MX1]|eukprot:XP_001743888.1 hypothetical protein [Monosiga brevicollis MX1]